MSAANIDDILSTATEDLRARLNAAFEAGRALGRREASGQVRDKIVGFLDSIEAHDISTDIPDITSPPPAAEEARAVPGTVKPAIKSLIEDAKDGIRTSEIIEKTGFKENSVRGTLSTLKVDGFAERRGELWFLRKRKGPPALASEPS